MATIRSLDSAAYRVPLPFTLSDSTHGVITHFELITAQVTDADGETGLGYTYTVDSGGTAIHALIARYLAPILAGRDADEIEKTWQAMWWGLHFGGRGGQTSLAIAAVDIALWDLAAKRAGKPLWRHLGGYDPVVPCYAGGIDLQFTEAELLAQADRFQEQGFRAIKMKVGRDSLREDVARVRAMRRHLGDDFPLMADANMRWSADTAIRAARLMADHDLVWLEEPTIPDDVAGHVRILREGGHPIATGENLHSLHEFKELIAQGGVSFPEPDVATVGGVTVFMKVAAVAEAFNLPVTSHGVHDLTVHLLAASPNRSFLEIHGFGLDRFIAEPMALRDGRAIAPERPGHGVALDVRALEQYRIG
ncbi:MAG TPA: mandelate racemase/muconate lactonizing enzyme family protein [Acetobacteraceae bacterium]|nr:mandelate racemase/muconate lactonizing enzyme family protein [Acetobacteraceae bacterium]